MPHLFAYGTLMCEDILLEVAGIRPRAVPGLRSGFTPQGRPSLRRRTGKVNGRKDAGACNA